MQCRLCLQEKDLRNSHVFPEYFYESLYDEKHRYIRIKQKDNRPFEQKGHREKLLCDDCEGLLSKYEWYARGVLLGGIEFSPSQQDRIISAKNIDYEKFKLFEISLLWRAGVAKDSFFESVKLGKHESILRKMLIMGDPGKYHEYGCLIIFNYNDEEDILSKVIFPPERHRTEDGHICYAFILGGFLWLFVVSSHVQQHIRRDLFLTEGGELQIYLSNAPLNGLLNKLISLKNN